MVDIKAAWQQVRTRKLRFITFKMVDHVPMLDVKGDKKLNFKEYIFYLIYALISLSGYFRFKKVLPNDEPRFAVYDLEFTTIERASRITNTMFFIFWYFL
jgi:hypothetical protein